VKNGGIERRNITKRFLKKIAWREAGYLKIQNKAPHPQPLSPEYRGEGRQNPIKSNAQVLCPEYWGEGRRNSMDVTEI
jgi:hypothetical protein